jgi:hypothetical protein
MTRAIYRTFAATVVLLFVAGPARSTDKPLELGAEGEAYALRVEYDLPIPLGPGTIPHVIGDVRRSGAENAHGIAGAPTRFDAVVAGTVADPHKEPRPSDDDGIKDENTNPHTECFYPGALVDTDISYPTDMREETANVPPVSYATAKCAAGPMTQIEAWAAGVGTPGMPSEAIGPLVAAGEISAHALLRPRSGHLESTVDATAQSVSIGGGAIQIGSVRAEGGSSATGPGGKAFSEARITIADIEAGGQRFSIANKRVIVGSNVYPIGSSEAQSFFNAVNAGLEPTGCHITAVSPAEVYPQGFLLKRKPPTIEVAKDGTYAASMEGGLLILCDVPEEISAPTTFQPQRVQFLVGFAYTMAQALEAPGGFGLAGLAGGATTTVVRPPAEIAAPPPAERVAPQAPAPAEPAARTLGPQAAGPVNVRQPLPRGLRGTLFALGLVLMLVLAQIGVRRLREALES